MATQLPRAPTPVVASIDLRFASEQVLEAAIDLANRRGCEVLALHVVHEDGDSIGFYRRMNTGNPTTPAVGVAESLVRELVAEVLARPERAKQRVPVAIRVEEGLPGHRIVEVADQVDACALVMATHSRHGLSRLWHGSVSDQVRRSTRRELVVLQGNGSAQTAKANDLEPTQVSVAR
jgi:nucleotide-binding universal stress UspA family protein